MEDTILRLMVTAQLGHVKLSFILHRPYLELRRPPSWNTISFQTGVGGGTLPLIEEAKGVWEKTQTCHPMERFRAVWPASQRDWRGTLAYLKGQAETAVCFHQSFRSRWSLTSLLNPLLNPLWQLFAMWSPPHYLCSFHSLLFVKTHKTAQFSILKAYPSLYMTGKKKVGFSRWREHCCKDLVHCRFFAIKELAGGYWTETDGCRHQDEGEDCALPRGCGKPGEK